MLTNSMVSKKENHSGDQKSLALESNSTTNLTKDIKQIDGGAKDNSLPQNIENSIVAKLNNISPFSKVAVNPIERAEGKGKASSSLESFSTIESIKHDSEFKKEKNNSTKNENFYQKSEKAGQGEYSDKDKRSDHENESSAVIATSKANKDIKHDPWWERILTKFGY
jgi:hypothetical protein